MRLRLLGIALLCLATSSQAGPTHGFSVFGDLKYPATFTHFDYVNPDAPKGGRMALIGPLANDTFDSFNNYIVKGDPAQGLALMFDSLMERAMDDLMPFTAWWQNRGSRSGPQEHRLRAKPAKFADGTAHPRTSVTAACSQPGHENIKLTKECRLRRWRLPCVIASRARHPRSAA
jgi:hypothetical protein